MDSITDFMHINLCKFQEVVEGPKESESKRASMFGVMSSRSNHQGGELLHVDKDCGGVFGFPGCPASEAVRRNGAGMPTDDA